MSNQEIEEYCNLDNVYDKAGAYAIQEDAGKYITSIEGDYNNVVGLLVDELKKYIN
jgi:septum formation protein